MAKQALPPSLDELRGAAERLAGDFDLRMVVLFGSAARQEPLPGDIDLAVLGDGRIDTLELTNRLAVLLARNDVDVVDLRGVDPLLMMLVARDGIPLFEQRPGEMASFTSLAARRFADTKKFREAEHQEILSFIARRTAPQ